MFQILDLVGAYCAQIHFDLYLLGQKFLFNSEGSLASVRVYENNSIIFRVNLDIISIFQTGTLAEKVLLNKLLYHLFELVHFLFVLRLRHHNLTVRMLDFELNTHFLELRLYNVEVDGLNNWYHHLLDFLVEKFLKDAKEVHVGKHVSPFKHWLQIGIQYLRVHLGSELTNNCDYKEDKTHHHQNEIYDHQTYRNIFIHHFQERLSINFPSLLNRLPSRCCNR